MGDFLGSLPSFVKGLSCRVFQQRNKEILWLFTVALVVVVMLPMMLLSRLLQPSRFVLKMRPKLLPLVLQPLRLVRLPLLVQKQE
jgi:hypothetical protein